MAQLTQDELKNKFLKDFNHQEAFKNLTKVVSDYFLPSSKLTASYTCDESLFTLLIEGINIPFHRDARLTSMYLFYNEDATLSFDIKLYYTLPFGGKNGHKIADVIINQQGKILELDIGDVQKEVLSHG